jgi:hypothetical protein
LKKKDTKEFVRSEENIIDILPPSKKDARRRRRRRRGSA